MKYARCLGRHPRSALGLTRITQHGFGGNREKASEAGRKGGQTSGTSGAVGGDDGGPDKEQDPAVDETYKPEEDDTV